MEMQRILVDQNRASGMRLLRDTKLAAVILPEVFLKCVSVARNLGAAVDDLTTANLDMFQHYRPRRNVLERPSERGIALTGHHELLLPLLRVVALRRLANHGGPKQSES